MSTMFSEDNNNFAKFKVIQGGNTNQLKDVDDIITAIKAYFREICERIDYLEQQMSDDNDREIATLVRQSQYIQALLDKNKIELEKIFFPNGLGNCIIPDVFQWYQEPN